MATARAKPLRLAKSFSFALSRAASDTALKSKHLKAFLFSKYSLSLGKRNYIVCWAWLLDLGVPS
jgi:hypothetical protein